MTFSIEEARYIDYCIFNRRSDILHHPHCDRVNLMNNAYSVFVPLDTVKWVSEQSMCSHCREYILEAIKYA